MSTQITTAFVQQYREGITHLAQQTMSHLRDTVEVATGVVGKRAYFDQLGVRGRPSAVTTRYTPITRTDTPHARRAVDLVDYEDSDLTDNFDLIRTLNDPSSEYLRSFAAQFAREIDHIIIDAATATALTGETGGTSTAFPAGQQVAVNYVASGSATDSNLTVPKVRRAAEILNNNNVPLGDRYAIIAPSQLEALQRDDHFVSADYVAMKPLMSGELPQVAWMGFNWRMVADDDDNMLALAAGNVRSCLFYHKTGIKLAIGAGGDTKGSIDRRVDLTSQPWQVSWTLTAAATRMEENKVVEVLCDEDL